MWRAIEQGAALGAPRRLSKTQALDALTRPTVRSVVLQRMLFGAARDRLLAGFLRRAYPGERTLEINCAFGPGLRVAHGYGTVLWARSIGERCTIYHNVTLGVTYGKRAGMPTIGDRVRIYPGAVVLGPVTVGHDAVVQSGSIVLNDVPPGTVVSGRH